MTTDLELEAELMIYGETFGKIGSLKVSRKSNKVEQKIVKLELDNDFIEDVAKANNICSIRVTQYGDMRSFIGQSTATIDSYGESEDMVDYFDCLDADSQDSQSRVYDLTRKDSFNVDKFRTLAGKGLILKNIDQDKSLAFGIFLRKDDEYLTI